MSRISVETIGKAILSNNELRLLVRGSSTTRGRVRQMLRLRPTVVDRIQKVAAGPMYLIIEIALEELAKKLEAMDPNERPIFIDASLMDPTEEDAALYNHLPKQRGGRKSVQKIPKA